MRTLFILRGCMGSGKSYWVAKNHLEPYTLSSDAIRMMFQSPIIKADGTKAISQDNDSAVWSLLLDLLEARMRRGEFVVVDGTHYRNTLIAKYKNLIHKYRYRAYVVDFSDVPLETCLQRNKQRDAFKFVPEEHIKKVHALLQVKNKPQSYTKLISREQAEDLLETKVFDFNEYNDIVVFGDIHGCYEPLKEWFDMHPFSDKTKYIFTGDYLDRGIQNKEVLEYLFTIMDKPNVFLLEGNHEKWLRLYAHDEDNVKPLDDSVRKILKKYNKLKFYSVNEDKIHSREFLQHTLPQINTIDKKSLKHFCDKLGQMAYFTFNNKTYFISHGGMPCEPNIFTATVQMIDGVGKYGETQKMYDSWCTRDTILVHAHRNSLNHPVQVADNIYNLCDTVEFGGYLRVMHIERTGITTYKIKNDVFKEQTEEQSPTLSDYLDIVAQLNSNTDLIMRKDFGDISSYNFTRKAFYNRKWNDLTTKARGLFIENATNKVVMRSYNKFFNYSERIETSTASLSMNLQFPLTCYRKENGFLAMISYYKGNLLFGSKSTINGQFVDYIKEVYEGLADSAKTAICEYLKSHDVTMVFECVHHADNTHPIWYAKDHLYLLDIIDNSFEFSKLPYNEVKSFADTHGIEVKEKVAEFKDFNEFTAFKKSVDSTSEHAKDPTFEGYVFEDSTGFMFKYKTPFYRFWKSTRGYLEKCKKNKQEAEATAVFREERDVQVFAMLQKLDNVDNLSIVGVEKMFYGDKIKPVDL